MKKFLLKYRLLLIVILLGLSTSWPLFLPGYFSHQDTLQVMRVYEMRKCLDNLQIPCRWVPDMGYGYGYPLFNYYNPFPYYLGAVLSFVVGYIVATKILFFIPLILGGVGMYLLSKEVYGEIPALVSSSLFIFAPYRALDTYVRGDIAEAFSIGLVPLVFYLSLRLLRSKRRSDFAFLTIVTGIFLTSHNLMIIIFLPLFIFWLIYWWKKENGNLKSVLISLVLGAGLAAYFLLPAFFEQRLVQIDSLTRFSLNFRANFVNLNQLFINRSWGYGLPALGFAEPISLQIGLVHWLVGVASLIVIIFLIIKKKRYFLPLILFLFFVFSIFMMHDRSAFVWERVDFLKFIQFPWRFLALTIFCASLLGGFLFSFKKYQLIISIVAVAITVILNLAYFQPAIFYPKLTDQDELSGTRWEDAQKAAIRDYLPLTAPEPHADAPSQPVVNSGLVKIGGWTKTTNSFKFNANVSTPAEVELSVFDFPNWEIKSNNKVEKEKKGKITLYLDAGQYSVEGELKNTPVRVIGNTITLLSGALLILLYGKNRKIFK